MGDCTGEAEASIQKQAGKHSPTHIKAENYPIISNYLTQYLVLSHFG